MLESASWKFAKSMPGIPHFYTLRNTWESSRQFDNVVQLIRYFGYDTKFYSRMYRYWDCNGYHHWTMGEPIHETLLINRAVKKYNAAYDIIADTYDSMYADESARRQSADVVSMVGDLTGPVLDIGCGTGLLFEFGKDVGSAGRYVGIDISQTMLDRFARKFPMVNGTLVRCSLEDYWGQGFRKIVALFGAASYLNASDIDRIPAMLAPGGEAFLMFYRPDYVPAYYSTRFEVAGARPDHCPYVHQQGDEEYSRYIIRRIRAS